jgi:hypothetical protein
LCWDSCQLQRLCRCAGGAFYHHAASELCGDGRPDRFVLCGRGRHRASELSMEEE